MTWPEEDTHGVDEPDAPRWTPPTHLPADAERIGLNRSVPDGALLDFAGSLDPAKPLHRITAWVMLVVFGFPVVIYVARLLWGLLF